MICLLSQATDLLLQISQKYQPQHGLQLLRSQKQVSVDEGEQYEYPKFHLSIFQSHRLHCRLYDLISPIHHNYIFSQDTRHTDEVL